MLRGGWCSGRGVHISLQTGGMGMLNLKARQRLQAIDNQLAMLEYRATEAASREKTSRLRAARLARDAVIVLPAPKQREAKG